MHELSIFIISVLLWTPYRIERSHYIIPDNYTYSEGFFYFEEIFAGIPFFEYQDTSHSLKYRGKAVSVMLDGLPVDITELHRFGYNRAELLLQNASPFYGDYHGVINLISGGDFDKPKTDLFFTANYIDFLFGKKLSEDKKIWCTGHLSKKSSYKIYFEKNGKLGDLKISFSEKPYFTYKGKFLNFSLNYHLSYDFNFYFKKGLNLLMAGISKNPYFAVCYSPLPVFTLTLKGRYDLKESKFYKRISLCFIPEINSKLSFSASDKDLNFKIYKFPFSFLFSINDRKKIFEILADYSDEFLCIRAGIDFVYDTSWHIIYDFYSVISRDILSKKGKIFVGYMQCNKRIILRIKVLSTWLISSYSIENGEIKSGLLIRFRD